MTTTPERSHISGSNTTDHLMSGLNLRRFNDSLVYSATTLKRSVGVTMSAMIRDRLTPGDKCATSQFSLLTADPVAINPARTSRGSGQSVGRCPGHSLVQWAAGVMVHCPLRYCSTLQDRPTPEAPHLALRIEANVDTFVDTPYVGSADGRAVKDDGVWLEIAQVQILSVTIALFISTINLVLYRLSPLFCFIRSSHMPIAHEDGQNKA
ncbi:hypothetical protein J6590_063535 [Homalodisca vitripennis]|nr:hypothetical protein J6590_063535 [Homalodisca vitripennis]